MLWRQLRNEADVACFQYAQRQTRHHTLSIEDILVFGGDFDQRTAIVYLSDDFIEFDLGLVAVPLEDGFEE